MDFSKYSSERLMHANQVQMQQILAEFKKDHLPMWKFGLFAGYHFVALTFFLAYGKALRGKQVEPSPVPRGDFSLANLVRKGTRHSLVMFGVYSLGLWAVCRDRITIDLLRKYNEVESTFLAFGLKFDPNYQEHLIYTRMRHFNLPESLIDEVKAELKEEKEELIKAGGLLPATIKKIEECEDYYQRNKRAKEVS